MIRHFSWVAVLCLMPAAVRAESKTYELTVAAGDTDRANTPIRVSLKLPAFLAKAGSVTLEDASGKKLTAQLTAPGLLAPAGDVPTKELHFILPNLKAGATATFKATISTDPPAPAAASFSWKEMPNQTAELLFAGKPVLLYMGLPYDESPKEKRDQTYKVFHHLYDPDGKQQLTQGAGGKLYPHHRGIYYGFSKVTHGDGKKADIWHCTNNVHQSHEKFLAREAGPVLGRHLVEIGWYGQDKAVFARELRELTVYHVPGGTLVQFASRLKSNDGKVKVDGDPQHAGFQFRQRRSRGKDQGTDLLPTARRCRQARRNPQLGRQETRGPRQPAVERNELRGRRPALTRSRTSTGPRTPNRPASASAIMAASVPTSSPKQRRTNRWMSRIACGCRRAK